MKQVYAFLFFVSATISGAQTLTQSFNEPVVGDIDRNYRLDTSAYTNGLPVNTTGNNCTWNYASLSAIFPMIVDSFITPTAAPGNTAFPAATFVQHRDNIYTYYASNTSAQQTELLGGYSPTLTLTFSNTAIIASYPISYGYNLSDPVSGTFKYNTTNGACNGSVTISANGTGTLNLPNNTSIPNVLCLKSVEILTLSVGIFPFGTFNQTVYDYYMPGNKFPVLSVNYTIYQLIAGTPTITTNVYGKSSYFNVAGIHEQHLNKDDYDVFPNPFHDALFIRQKNQLEENTYTLYDIDGRLVLRTSTLPDAATQALQPGVYLLEITNSRGLLHQKVVKQ